MASIRYQKAPAACDQASFVSFKMLYEWAHAELHPCMVSPQDRCLPVFFTLRDVSLRGRTLTGAAPGECRAAQENGEFAGSFWLCAQCARALAPLSDLLVTPELTATVSALYEETVARLESSLQTVCADFQPDPYAKVRASAPAHASSLLLLFHSIFALRYCRSGIECRSTKLKHILNREEEARSCTWQHA